jgi:hypothetical protein
MDRTVAVTGGSGELGLLEQEWQVVNFDRVPSSQNVVRFIRTEGGQESPLDLSPGPADQTPRVGRTWRTGIPPG